LPGACAKYHIMAYSIQHIRAAAEYIFLYTRPPLYEQQRAETHCSSKH
jgi:hypothetical protein